ncbi:MAG: ATP-binding protein [Methanospirillaceae archaeon]|nr:ATP-binding protein [Methanospirillaceae archaeon]
MKIKDVILQQKTELNLRIQEPFIPRTAEIKNPQSKLIKIVIGPRRAGKSFFITRFLIERGIFGYVNFDDEQLTDPEKIPDILTAIDDIYQGTKTLLLDEIQNIPGWELLANRLARQGYELYITGSNAHLLSKELATHLTGRHTVTTIFPFSFKEFLRIKNGEFTESAYRNYLDEYSLKGGFPEPLMIPLDRKDYLNRLFDAVIYKDIIRRYKVRSPQGLGDLAQYLCSTISSEYSVHGLTKVSGCQSDRTVRKYLEYLQEAFLFFSIPRFSYKVRVQVSSNKKIYCIDNGFITAKGFSFSKNQGSLLENIVATTLRKHELSGFINLFYWKNAEQEEVDFVIQQAGLVTTLIQVCTDVSDEKTRFREVRALLKASRDLSCTNLIVLSIHEERESKEEWFGMQGVIRYIPVWKWLLMPWEERI